MTGHRERRAVQMLLVRAVEERAPELFGPDALADAVLATISARDDKELLEKRASYLCLRLPRAMRGWVRLALVPADWAGWLFLAAVVVGFLSNYLGPSHRVYVVFNPLTFLLLWNLVVYVVMGWRLLRRFALARSPASGTEPLSRGGAATRSDPATDPEGSGGGVARWLFGSVYLNWLLLRARYQRTRRELENVRRAGAAFWESYWDAAGPVLAARVETLVHIGAMGLLLGALLGIYRQAFADDYYAVWRSTFLTDPGSVTDFLNLLLGPASLLLDGHLLRLDAVRPLLADPPATLAGPWIHLLALTAVLLVLVPRAILATLSWRHARREARRVKLDLSEPYYAEKLAAAREGHARRIREGIAATFRLEVDRLAESTSVFVSEQYFDRIVAPALIAFRGNGGRIRDLENELEYSTDKFEPSLSGYLREAQQGLQRSLGAGIQAVIGRELYRAPGALEALAPDPLRLEQKLTASVATSIGDTIGATVTAAVATAVATISGGVGKALGVALLSGLLGTSGPIGLLIGGILAVAVVGGGYILGRDKVTKAVKETRIPALLLSAALRDAKIAQAREAIQAQVRKDIRDRFDLQVTEATDAVLLEMSRAVVEAAHEEDD